MKRTSQFVLVLALSVGASLPTHGQAPELSSEVVHLLTAIEGVPARLQLQNVLPDAATTLMQLSTNEGDVAVRLRAIRSLAQYPSVASRNQLKLLLRSRVRTFWSRSPSWTPLAASVTPVMFPRSPTC
jgi:hypothetical protein